MATTKKTETKAQGKGKNYPTRMLFGVKKRESGKNLWKAMLPVWWYDDSRSDSFSLDGLMLKTVTGPDGEEITGLYYKREYDGDITEVRLGRVGESANGEAPIAMDYDRFFIRPRRNGSEAAAN